jgi:hypothetical protein
MAKMVPLAETVTEEAQLTMECACGGCHPTATVYRNDPHYKRHDPRLAEGPCCCGRFFVVGEDAQSHAEEIAARKRAEGLGPNGYALRLHRVALPWGGVVFAVSADLRQ